MAILRKKIIYAFHSTMKCTKVKKPCKICFQAVTKKNGLQCQGACLKWAHFKCLNYTPGKIQDIKAGIIKVTCPCPDCITFEPKEVLAEPPYSCTNAKCPANTLPICESVDCPSKDSPIPTFPPPSERDDTTPECTPYSQTYPPLYTNPKRCPSVPQCPPDNNCILESAPQRECSPQYSSTPPKRSESPKRLPTPKYQPHPPCYSPHTNKVSLSSHALPSSGPKPLHCSPTCSPKCPPTCPSYQNLENGRKDCSPTQSKSCSNISKKSNSSGKLEVERMRAISSDSKVPTIGNHTDQKLLYSAIENLCKTVGQLSTQLQDLMCKMQQGYK